MNVCASLGFECRAPPLRTARYSFFPVRFSDHHKMGPWAGRVILELIIPICILKRATRWKSLRILIGCGRAEWIFLLGLARVLPKSAATPSSVNHISTRNN